MDSQEIRALGILQHMIAEDITAKQAYRKLLLKRLRKVDPDRVGGRKVADRLWSRIASCFRYSTLYRGAETGNLSIEFHQCKSNACPFCRYWYVLRQRARVINTLSYMLAEDSRRAGRLYFLVPTKQDRSSVKEDAAMSFSAMNKLLHGWLSRSRKERIRGKESIHGGAYKIETTVSKHTFEDWSWHYHANVVVESDDPDRMLDTISRAIPYRMTCKVLSGDWIKEFVKYSCKCIEEKKKEWNCDPYVEGPIRLLEDLLILQKRHSLSFFGNYWGMADRVGKWVPKGEARKMIWSSYPPLEKRLQVDGRLEDISEVPYQDVFGMMTEKAERYSKLYERAIDEFKADTTN